MKSNETFERQRRVLGCLSSLPRKIMSVHERENVPEFILHDICNEHCFNIIRAAYFVENPDFKCVKGVAGFCREEAYNALDHVWDDPQAFAQFMKNSLFNQKVRSLMFDHLASDDALSQHVQQHIAPQLGFAHPSWCTWDLKHYNHGLIVYEKADLQDEVFDQHFMNSLYLLGFCAIY